MIDVYEKFALDNYLSSYPEDKSFFEIIEMVEDHENDDVLVWDPFFYLDPEEVGSLIVDMVENLKENFIAKEEMQTKIAEGLKH
jgi:predicted nucleotide-binding protein (sugar kinase/HSP70/actin superfamily)